MLILLLGFAAGFLMLSLFYAGAPGPASRLHIYDPRRLSSRASIALPLLALLALTVSAIVSEFDLQRPQTFTFSGEPQIKRAEEVLRRGLLRVTHDIETDFQFDGTSARQLGEHLQLYISDFESDLIHIEASPGLIFEQPPMQTYGHIILRVKSDAIAPLEKLDTLATPTQEVRAAVVQEIRRALHSLSETHENGR